MKLGIKLPLGLTVLFLGLAGLMYWLLGMRLEETAADLARMQARLAEQEKKEGECAINLSTARAERTAVEIAARASMAIEAFIRLREADLSDPSLLGTAASGDVGGTVAELLKRGAGTIDMAVATDVRGTVLQVAPANDSLLGKPDPGAGEAVRQFIRRRPPLFEIRLAVGQPASLVASMGYSGGMPLRLKGLLREIASFDGILRSSLENAPEKADVRLVAADRYDTVVFGPTPDMVGRSLKDGIVELVPLSSAPEGQVTEIRYSLGRWMAVKRKAPLGITVVGMAAVQNPPVVAGETWSLTGGAGVPLPLLIGAVAIMLAIAIGMVVMPMQRLKGLAETVSALAQGATSVEMKGLSSGDEIGEMARAASKLSDLLTEERRRKEEAEGTAQQTQRDLKRAQEEARELSEYQKDLEVRTRREKEALDGELQAAHGEVENARAEVERIRADVVAKDQSLKVWEAAVAERDRMIGQVNHQLTDMQSQIVQLQQQVNGLNEALAAAQKELETRPKGPAAAFSLFAEATDALSIEVGSLLELVQGITAQMMETGEISEEQQSFVMGVTQRAARSQRGLADMRDYSLISRPDGLAREPVDLVLLLTDIVGTVQSPAEEKGLEFVADLPPSMPELIGDEGRLRQLFTVLLQNAVRFTPEGGRVSVSMGLKGEVAGIRIEDTAEPIPATAEEVLGHFHTTDEEIMELRGSGLRYPILRTIAEAHGGGIDLAINEQGGNLFFIRLPVRAFAPSAEATATLFAGVPEPVAAAPQAAAPQAAAPQVAAPAPASAGGGDLMDQALAFATGAAPAPLAPAPQAAAPAPQAAAPAGAPAPAGDGDLMDQALAFATSGAEAPSLFDLSAEAPVAPAPALQPAAQPAPEVDILDAALAFATGAGPAPAAAPAPEATPAPEAPVFDLSAAAEPPVAEPSAPVAPDAPISLDSIISASPEAPPDAAIPDLWEVPGGGTAPTLDALEAAPDGSTPPAAPDGGKGEPPPETFTFGSDEIVQE